MSIHFNLPRFDGTDHEQLQQLKRWVFLFLNQLQWELNNSLPEQNSVSNTVQTKTLIGDTEIDINTAYKDYNGSGDDRQAFFVFGYADDLVLHGVAIVSNNGIAEWEGAEGVTVSTRGGGVLMVTIPNNTRAKITIISGQIFDAGG